MHAGRYNIFIILFKTSMLEHAFLLLHGTSKQKNNSKICALYTGVYYYFKKKQFLRITYSRNNRKRFLNNIDTLTNIR